jgi:hypothetical protein
MSENPLTGLAILAALGGGWWYWMVSDIPRNEDMPKEQLAFVKMLDGYREQYVAASRDRNDIQMNRIFDSRQKILCNEGVQVNNWFGEINDIDTKWIDSRQRASVNLRVSWFTWGRGVTVDSRENPELFETMAKLKKNDHVLFSGRITTDSKGCLYEVSLTQHGRMTSPEFNYEFSAFKKVPKK